VTRDEVLALALSLPGAAQNAHFGKTDVRVRNRIFMSLPDDRTAVIRLTPADQDVLTAAEPAVFSRLDNAWGRKGWTRMSLPAVDRAAAESALRTAWRGVAPAGMKT
jgi:hypothetical protein